MKVNRAGYVVKVSTAGEVSTHYFDDGDFEYDAQKIQKLIGSKWIERVSLADAVMVVNEEGLLDGSRHNRVASMMYSGGYIAGDAVFVTEVMTEDGLDFAGLTQGEAEALSDKLNRLAVA